MNQELARQLASSLLLGELGPDIPKGFFTEDTEENEDFSKFGFYNETSASPLPTVWFTPGRIIRKVLFLRTSS